MTGMSCRRLTIWMLIAMGMQIIGLCVFVFSFFPVKPALSGVSGLESYRPPGNDSIGDFDVNAMSPHQLKSLFTDFSQISPPYARLILMVVDGLPAEFVLGKDREPPSKSFMKAMPYTQNLLKNGMAIGYHAQAAPPTVTMPRLKAMVSGAIGGFLDVAFNFNTQAFLDDNLLGQFFRIGWKMTMFGDNTWLKLFPGLFARHDGVSSFFVKDTVQVDVNVTRHLPEELNQDDWHLLILHYLGLDHVGHVGGRKSVLMAPKLREMDDVIKMIHLKSILPHDGKQGETLLLVVSDHGMTDSGNHGGSSYEETDSLVLFVGRSSKLFRDVSETQETISQVDIAPTLALLFGVPIPKNNVGVLAANRLQFLTGAQQLRALELNSWQLLRLLKAQLPGLSCADSDDSVVYRWSKVGQCNGEAEEMLCCLYSNAVDLHSLWKSTASSSVGGHHYDDTISAYNKFLMTASEWLTRRVTDKPFGRLAFGVLALFLSCVLFLRLLFCLRTEQCLEDNLGVMKGHLWNWNLDEKFVLVVIVITVVSMGSSSMVEEEQYIWHFLTSTLFFILFRKTMQFLPLGEGRLHGLPYGSRYLQVSAIVLVLFSGRVMRGWHQGGVNWTHLRDIAKWLEQAGSNYIRAMEVLSGILIITTSLFAFFKMRFNRWFTLLVTVFYLLSGSLILLHIINYQDNLFMASGHGATFTAQLIYVVLGISTCFVVLASPWFPHSYMDAHQSSPDRPLSASQPALSPVIHLKESSFVIGWTYMLSWSLLQLLLQQPINLMPVFLLLLQTMAAMIYFSNDRAGRKPWAEVAALYFIGMAGHFSLGNTNTLATIDVAGAFTGISSHSILFSGILMFCITYASPILVLLSLVMYISLKDVNHSRVDCTMDFGLLLKSALSIPLLVPLCINSVLLIAYTVVLLLMQNHLFVWSVFSPKYLYVCATTVCVYIGVCIVAGTEIYISLVCAFRSRRLRGCLVEVY